MKLAPDVEELDGELGKRESLMSTYGFDITEVLLRKENDEIEDFCLRCLKQRLILEKNNQALVLRKKREFFIHQVLNVGLGSVDQALDVLFEVIEYNKSTNRLVVYIRMPCNNINQRISPMSAFDISWGKSEVNNPIKVFWDLRGSGHQFTVHMDNTIGSMKKSDVVLGIDDKGELVLVKKDDTARRLVFKNLFESLTWRLQHRLSTFRLQDLTSLKKQGFMKDWVEPGTTERKMPVRSVSWEVMGRLIHEFLDFDESGQKLIPGDGYFATRIDRCSQHNTKMTNRKDDMNGNVDLTFTSDLFERSVFRVNTKHKAIQYIASQFFEVNLDIVFPLNLRFDITNDKPQNSHFIHHVLIVDVLNDADTAKDDPSLPVFFERVELEAKDISKIREFNRHNNKRISECGYFVKWIGKMEHAFDVQEAKYQEAQPILLFWQHRGRNQIYCLEEDQQTLHCIEKLDLAWGIDCDTLKLVLFNSPDVLKFSDISSSLQSPNNRLAPSRSKVIGAMSRATTEWESPMVISYGLLSAVTEIAFAP